MQDAGNIVTLLVNLVRITARSSNINADTKHKAEALSRLPCKHAMPTPPRDNDKGASGIGSSTASQLCLL